MPATVFHRLFDGDRLESSASAAGELPSPAGLALHRIQVVANLTQTVAMPEPSASARLHGSLKAAVDGQLSIRCSERR